MCNYFPVSLHSSVNVSFVFHTIVLIPVSTLLPVDRVGTILHLPKGPLCLWFDCKFPTHLYQLLFFVFVLLLSKVRFLVLQVLGSNPTYVKWLLSSETALQPVTSLPIYLFSFPSYYFRNIPFTSYKSPFFIVDVVSSCSLTPFDPRQGQSFRYFRRPSSLSIVLQFTKDW